MFSGIRQLQLILLKVSLLLGVEVHTGVEFQGLIEPTGENGIYIPASNRWSVYEAVPLRSAEVQATLRFDVFLTGWMAKLQPASHPAAAFQFDVFISAGGGRFVPDGETNSS